MPVPMLRAHVVRDGRAPYYVPADVPGPDPGRWPDGLPGTWTGAGAARLGLSGPVALADLVAVLAGRDPWTDRSLRTVREGRAVAGVDLTLAAPKAVSLVHLLGTSELAAQVGAAHAAAVSDAAAYVERVALGVRRSRGGVITRHRAAGAVAAGFLHRTSRADDPHLHSHLVVANATQGPDGLWSAVDTRRLFRHAPAVGALYDACLRAELTGRIGAAWEPGPGGRWVLAGVDPALCRLFSQRTAAIDEHAHRRVGHLGGEAVRRTAAVVDRPPKSAGLPLDELRQAWRDRAEAFGLDPADLGRVVGRARPPSPGAPVDLDRLEHRLQALAERDAALYPPRLVAAVADAVGPGAPGARIVDLVDDLTRSAARRCPSDRAPGALPARAVLDAVRADGGLPADRSHRADGGVVVHRSPEVDPGRRPDPVDRRMPRSTAGPAMVLDRWG